MLFNEMTPQHHDHFPIPSSGTGHKMESKHLWSIRDLLRNKMGMTRSAAGSTALRAHMHKSLMTYMSKFLKAAIEDQIDEYKKQSFAKFGLDIAVNPPSNAKCMELLVEHFGEVTVGYHSYVFQPLHNKGSAKVMRTRLYHGRVQVHFCGSWRPVSAYLDEVNTDWTYEASPEFELNRQYRWWRSNGKSFEITKLPGEIRNAIFDFVFPSEAQPFPTAKCRKSGRLVPTFQRSYTSLMRTNRQLYIEASDWFYKTTTFTINYPQIFSKTLDYRFLRDRLRRVRLSLTHSEYMDLFSPKAWDVSTEPFVKRQLREMSNLTSLEIHIHAPSRITTKIWLEGACQKAAVDMIVDAAWPSIRGLPVTITGYVKDSQKKAIEARVQSERSMYTSFAAWRRDVGQCHSLPAYDAWVDAWVEGMKAETLEEQGGVRLDGEPWVKAEAEIEAEESGALQWDSMSTQELREIMWCTCETRCELDNWDPAD